MPQRELVLVTGGSGFIGSAVAKRLGETYRVVNLDRPDPADSNDRMNFVPVDLGDDDSVRDALATVRDRYGQRVASVVHLAAYYDVSGEPNPLYEKVTVQGTRRLIDGLQSFEVEQFAYASTMLVHRPTDRPDETIDETSPIDPSWAYPESKVRTEALLRERHGDIPIVLLRIAGVYADEGRQPFLAEQIARIYEHRLISHFYPGMLCAGQAFIHIDDLADAIARLVERRTDLPAELPLLVGEPEALGYAEIQDIIGCALHGDEWETIRIPKSIAKAGAWIQNELISEDSEIKPWMVDASNDHYVLDIGRARKLLDWEPKHRLRDTLPKMVAALKRDPTGWYRANRLNPALIAWYGQRPDSSTSDQAPPAHTDTAKGGHGHMAMMDEDERKKRWAHYANIGLGLWLATSPFIFGILDANAVPEAVRQVTIERQLPSVEWRSTAMAWSDGITGILIAIFGALSLSKRTAWFGQWANCFAGLWLLFAPLVFWVPSAAVYANDTLVGALVIAFAILVPMMPGMSMAGMMDRKSIPPGWTYSPSTAAQRFPIVVLGFIGLIISRHLAAYQLGHIDWAWEPFFAGSAADSRNGTEEIITSWVSEAWPIADGGLGATSYMLEILMAVMGTRDRWRTMPWMVTFFGILVVPLGVTSIYFIIIQPILLGTWSTLALLAGAAMLAMIPFALDELIAMGQFLYWSRCHGKPLIRTFFKGDAVEGGEEYKADAMLETGAAWSEAKRGVTLPWTLAATFAIGAFLMLTRPLLGAEGSLANTDHLVGALAITVTVIALAEVARTLRFLNVPLGAWLVVGALTQSQASGVEIAVRVVLGLALIALSFPRGPRSKEHYAGWDRFVI